MRGYEPGHHGAQCRPEVSVPMTAKQGRLQTFLDEKTACDDDPKGHVTTW